MLVKQDEGSFHKLLVKSHNLLPQCFLLFINRKYINHKEWSSLLIKTYSFWRYFIMGKLKTSVNFNIFFIFSSNIQCCYC